MTQLRIARVKGLHHIAHQIEKVDCQTGEEWRRVVEAVPARIVGALLANPLNGPARIRTPRIELEQLVIMKAMIDQANPKQAGKGKPIGPTQILEVLGIPNDAHERSNL